MSAEINVSVGLAALSVAMNAKLGRCDQMDVDAMVATAQQLLKEGDVLRLACTEFATGFEMHWRDPEQIERLGENLRYAVELHARPDLEHGHG